MAYAAQVLRVFIASPGDVVHERDLVEQAISNWNRSGQSQRTGIILLPQRWELDAVQRAGRPTQAEIDEQLLQHADIVIAIFHSRLGRPTAEFLSGTVEEIEYVRPHTLGTHMFVSRQDLPWNHDQPQLRALRDYEEALSARGEGPGYFHSDEELRQFTDRALDYDIDLYRKGLAATEVPLADPRSAVVAGRLGHFLRAAEEGDFDPDALDRILLRLSRTLRQLANIVARNIRYDLELYRSNDNRYLLYDLRKDYEYVVRDKKILANLCVQFLPRVLPPVGIPSEPRPSIRTDRQWKPWDIRFWPPVDRPEDWDLFREEVSVQVIQAQTKDPHRTVEVKLRRSERPVAGRPTGLVFEAELEIDSTWDKLCVCVSRVPHPMSLRAMHFYAGEACIDKWQIYAKTRPPRPPDLRLTGITSTDVGVDLEVVNFGVCAATFRAIDAAILPDDAIIVTINDRASGPRA